jgi:hypothetical protein
MQRNGGVGGFSINSLHSHAAFVIIDKQEEERTEKRNVDLLV